MVLSFLLLTVGIPDYQPNENSDDPEYDPLERIKNAEVQIQKIRRNLLEIYQEEFLAQLMWQATNMSDRYKPVTHAKLKPGDLVLLKEVNIKPHHFPMGRVKKVVKNKLGEVTDLEIFKGTTRETVKRHASSVIPLLAVDSSLNMEAETARTSSKQTRPKRLASGKALSRIRDQLK